MSTGRLKTKSNVGSAVPSRAGSRTTSIQKLHESKSDITRVKASSRAGSASLKRTSPGPQPNIGSKNDIISAIKDQLAEEKGISTEYYHRKQLEGIIPLFLTAQSQQIVKCTIGEDVTEEKMFRLIPKSDLMQDMATRLAISDFTPAKEAIMAYPREELMLHYDPEYKYSQNFFLVVSPETVDMIINPPEESKETEAEQQKVKERKPWISHGSEKDVEMEWVRNLGSLVKINVSRKFSEFKAPCKFADRDAQDGFLEIKSYKDPTYDLNRMELMAGCQAVPELVSTESQTSWFRQLNFSCQYEPIEMDYNEQEEIQNSTGMEDFILNISTRLEQSLQQNEMINIYEDDYINLGEEEVAIEQGSHTILQEYQSFTDLVNSKDKCISCINWHPAQKGVLAVSCTQACGFEDKLQQGYASRSKLAQIIIWSFHDPIHPQLILESHEDVTCFEMNPQDSSIIVAGSVSGQILLWDISEYQEMLRSSRKTEGDQQANDDTESKTTPSLRYAVISSIEASHRGPVTDIKWLPKHYEVGPNGEPIENAENGDKQIVTCSLDGTVAIWDVRFKKDWKSLDLAWRPFIRVPISALDNSYDYSLTRVSLKTTFNEELQGKPTKPTSASDTPSNPEAKPAKSVIKSLSTKFYCATEEGDLIYADWITEKVSDEKVTRVEFAYGAHFGPMSEIARSPFFPDIILTVGGWSFHIWKEKQHMGPLLSSAQATSGVTCGKWSPTRPGVFYIGRADGMLEVWDLLDKSHSPATVQSVATSAISSIEIKQYAGKGSPQFIAIGDDAGTLHILETPKNLQKMTKNERVVISTYFDREIKRVSANSERKKNHVKDRAAFDAAVLEQAQAAAKALAAKQAEEQKAENNEEDVEELKEEKAYQAMELAFLEAENMLAPSAE
ncbi:WD repeat-containing protein 63 [Boothiomyces sp. JEL0866]|nr:WD repeat-containing protein 63 [Boothiomyces sp. JEL0866]